jgi:hypothetical protein
VGVVEACQLALWRWGGQWSGYPRERVLGMTLTDRGGVILVCLSVPGAGAEQERRLFRGLPELLSTAAEGPGMCRGFSISAGQQSVWITLGVK